MAWWAELDPETLRALYDRHPGLSLDEIAMKAMRDPRYADEFARLGADVEEYVAIEDAPRITGLIGGFSFGEPDEYPRPFIPKGSERAFAALVVAAALSETAGEPPAPISNDPVGMKRRSGPDPTFHEPDVVGSALSALPNVTAAVAESGLNKKDVLRAEKLQRWELLRWDGATLWSDPERVWRRAGEIALRVLSADGSEWLDPLQLLARP